MIMCYSWKLHGFFIRPFEKWRYYALTISVRLSVHQSAFSELFMPPSLGAVGIMFSGLSIRPSVWSPKYPLSTCTWVRWSIPPTVTILRHVHLSVHPERFPGICRRTHRGNALKFCTLIYPDHLQKWLDYGHGLLVFLISALFWHSEMGQILGFRSFPGEPIEEMAWHCACWCILTTFRTD